jgi:membrane protein
MLLSLFPILTTLTAALVQIRAQSVVKALADFLREIAPPGTEDMILSRLRERGPAHISFSIAAILVSLWAGSGAMISLMDGFKAAYRLPTSRPFLKERAMAIFLVFTAALPAIGASALLIFGNRIEATFVHSVGIPELSGSVEFAWHSVRYVLAFCTTTFVTGLLYFFGPNYRAEPEQLKGTIPSRFWRVWPGAIVSTILWFLATAGFAWYVQHLADYNIFYGSVGTVIVLIIWLYLIACIALIGCEFNAERERIFCEPAMSDTKS